MAEIIKGINVSKSIFEDCANIIQKENLKPSLSLIRVGNREDDIAYEKNILNKCSTLNIKVDHYLYDENINEDELIKKINSLNSDNNVKAIMTFRPLPKHLNVDNICDTIIPSKDVDGSTSLSLASVMKGKGAGYAPCTAEAVISMLDYYNIDVEGKNVVVCGRSLVVGKPVSLLLQQKNATVTMCHSKTNNLQAITKKADIVITAIGKAEMFTKDYFSKGQIVIDVGMNYSQEKRMMVGDVAFDEVSEIVDKITPPKGGVGSITTAILMKHIVEASRKH